MRLCIPDSVLHAPLVMKRKWVLVADGTRTTLLSIPPDMHVVDVEDDMFGAVAELAAPEALGIELDPATHDLDKTCRMLGERFYAYDMLCILAPAEMLAQIYRRLPEPVLAKARFGVPQAPLRPVWDTQAQPFEVFGRD